MSEEDFGKNLAGMVEALCIMQNYGITHGNIQPSKIFYVESDQLLKIGGVD